MWRARFVRHLFVVLALVAAAAASSFDIRTYGAIGDGKTLNTFAINKCVGAAHADWAARGGGDAPLARVLVADGVYVSGQIMLLSGVFLDVRPTATLLAAGAASDYPLDANQWAFVYANGAEHVGLGGGGTLDGNWTNFVAKFDAINIEYIAHGWPGCAGRTTSDCRPMLVKLFNSTDVDVDDITLTGSAFWTFHVWACQRVTVSRMRALGDARFPNNDGIDIDSSQHVLVQDSHIDVADDGVCIKSTAGMQDTFNITVRRVRVRSRSNAIKFGSTTPTDIHDLLFEDVTVWDSNGGLSIQARDAGTVSNIVFRNVFLNGTRQWPGIANASGAEFGGWWGSGENLWISTMPRTPDSAPGRVVNVTYENIVGIGQNANFLSGRAPGNRVENVVLRNVTLTIDRWPAWNYSHPDHDYRPTTCVEDLEAAPTDGLFVEAVSGLVLDGVVVRFNNANAQPYWTHVCFNLTKVGSPVVQRRIECLV